MTKIFCDKCEVELHHSNSSIRHNAHTLTVAGEVQTFEVNAFFKVIDQPHARQTPRDAHLCCGCQSLLLADVAKDLKK